MRKAWLDAGLPSPRIELAASEKEFIHAVAKTGFPAICKPTGDVGGGSRGVRKLDADTDLPPAYRFSSSFSDSPEVLVEPFFEGVEHSVEVLMRNGQGVALMVSDKVKSPLPYRVDKSVIYPTVMDGGHAENVRRVSIEAAKAVGLVDGAAHVELCTLPDGSQRLFEIGLRCGGGATPHPIAELVSGVNEIVEYAEILLGNGTRDFSPKYARGAVFHFITARPGTLKSVTGFEKAAAMPGIIDAYLTAKPGDAVRELKTSADRLGYFVSAAPTGPEAYRMALAAERELDFIYEG
jgi:biotin carboxylase